MPRRNWIKTLWTEADAWVNDQLISPAQREQIHQRYARRLEENRFAATILILGAVLVGIGLILFVASNWQVLGRAFKISLLLATLISCYAAGYRLRHEPGTYPRVGEALLLLGAITYGATLWLVAQIFQLPYNHADSLLAWLVGLLPIAWLLRSSPVLVLTAVLAPAWLVVLMAQPGDTSVFSYLWLDHPRHSVYLRYLPLLAAMAVLCYRQRQRAALFVTLIGAFVWLSRCLFVTMLDISMHEMNALLLWSALYLAYGCLLYALGMRHYRQARFGSFTQLYKYLAFLFIFGGNYVLTFTHHVSSHADKALVIPPMGFVVYLAFLAAGVVAALQLRDQHPPLRHEARALLALTTLYLIGMHLAPAHPVAISVYFNLVLVGMVLAFLYLGYALRLEGLFRLALYGFALVVLARYCDTFWKLLPRSLFFLVGGLLLIGGGIVLERQRKAVIHNMRAAG